MIPSSLPAKTAAFIAAAVVLGALPAMLCRADPVRVEGGGIEQAAASLGSGFADLAEGSPAAPDPPRPLEPDAAPVTAADSVETAVSPPPEAAATAETASPLAPETAPAVARPPEDISSPLIPSVAPVEAAPAVPTTGAAATPPETIIGEALDPESVLRSPRPRSRPKALVQARRQPDPPPRRSLRDAAKPEPVRQSPRGNADRSAQAGSTTGDSTRRAAPANPGSTRSAQAGNAAASAYPGLVMERLSRLRRPSVRAGGTATVAFNIAGSGALASVAVARSSGSASLDAEAVRFVRRGTLSAATRRSPAKLQHQDRGPVIPPRDCRDRCRPRDMIDNRDRALTGC